jgi:HAD superfamily hydrolase (TIGR01490 family)
MNLALFDFDGTITHKDAFTAFLLYAAPKKRQTFSKLFLFPFIAAYKLGFIPAKLMRPATAYVAFRNLPKKKLDKLGEAFAENWIELNVRDEALQQIQWHRDRGDHIVVVSASLDTYLRPWCRENRIDLICSTLEHSAKRYTGRYVQGDCSNEVKAERIQQSIQLKDYKHVYAYGDTPEDRAMLALADTAVYQWDQLPRR